MKHDNDRAVKVFFTEPRGALLGVLGRLRKDDVAAPGKKERPGAAARNGAEQGGL